MSITKLINNLESALDNYWDDLSNLGYVEDSSPVYEAIAELEDLGLGKVFIKDMHGRRKWFSLEETSFH